jgi:hypothetical protein
MGFAIATESVPRLWRETSAEDALKGRTTRYASAIHSLTYILYACGSTDVERAGVKRTVMLGIYRSM